MTDYKLLENKIKFIYKDKRIKLPKEKSLDSAIKIFKELKQFEKFDRNGKVDYEKELLEAKYDLRVIFGIDIKGLSKNELYMTHQSMWVNTLYRLMLEKGDL